MARARWGLVAAGAAVFVGVTSQLLVPNLGEREIEARLTENGGSAEVTLGAFPAARLLFSDGERFEVRARDLDLDLGRREEVFDHLDGFTIVDVAIADSRAGPFDLSNFTLARNGGGPYHLTATGSTSPESLVDYGVDNLELPGGGIAGLAMDLLGIDTNVNLPVDLDMQIESDAGRVRVVSGGGTVAGVPTDTFAQLLTDAIVVRL